MVTARQAAAEGALPVDAQEHASLVASGVGSLRLDVLRLAQQAGATSDPGHPAAPDEVVDRADTYWKWITR